MFQTSAVYSLRKSKTVLRRTFYLYEKKKKSLSPLQNEELRSTLLALQKEVMEKRRREASDLSKQLESLAKLYLVRHPFVQVVQFVVSLSVALVVAIVIRQMWFEPYEIPTGSMRPTFKEQDRLVVSKTDFGINVPILPEHLYFDPKLVQRNGIIIFTVADMDVEDPDTLDFYIFPGKKQYIKRCLGKPGDTVYFYGGKMYGIDKDGNDISAELQLPQLAKIDHIPFIHFEGKVLLPQQAQAQGTPLFSTAIVTQMNEPIAKLQMSPSQSLVGEMMPLTSIRDTSMPAPTDIGQLWGIDNYATARLLTKEEMKEVAHVTPSTIGDGLLYLELKHHPSIRSLKLARDPYGRLRPTLNLNTSYIPLQEHHLRAIWDNMYTARFIVKNGFAYKYGVSSQMPNPHFLPHLPGVPDGTYEFYYGKAYSVKWQGITQELPANHPLYKFSPDRMQLFFNLGIEFDTRFTPQLTNKQLDTSRYAYYSDGDLCLLNAPVFKHDDPTLLTFVDKETKRQQAGYLPFLDTGAPNLDKIKRFGLKLPDKMYLALGDNYAMSGDSRVFGFVPEGNLRGGPIAILWPPGSRWGRPNEPTAPLFNFPRTLIWLLGSTCVGIWGFLHHKRNKLPLLTENQK
jgi:signal peptidase I